MNRPRSAIRAVLLQVRANLEARNHERLCFMESAGLTPEEFDYVDLVKAPDLTWDRVRDADVVFIGGAGEYSATGDHPFTEPLAEIVRRIADVGRPLLASCWGHHFLARALGGRVETDMEHAEVGTFDVELTEAGLEDELFGRLPWRFATHLGHHDRVVELPPDFVELARSERCGHQIIRLRDRPIYGTQFHAEMNREHMEARLLMYRDSYLPQEMEASDFERMLRDTPEAAGLVRAFLEQFV
jgi:GMP synthase (glutamine-hydrolysing)